MRLPNDRTSARVTKYVLLIAGLVIAATLTGFPARVLNSYEVNQRVLALEQRLAARQAENESLQHELARRHTEAYIRTMAKERLGLVEPGEELVLLPLDGDRPDSAMENTSVPVKDLLISDTPYDAEWGYFLEWVALLKRNFT
ncbi:MAG: septum formation initiator family protein [Chloroflexi bacterium]|nr:septum formation initiator family protein [Chloroflexota bacterium]